MPPDEGHAYGRVVTIDDAHVFEGWEIVATPSVGYALRFRLIVGPDFVARALEIDADGPRGLRRLSVRRNPKGAWWADGKRRPDLDGCLDVDVAATPLTNTPTIRRLALPPGGAADVDVAWVDVPALTISVLRQRYEHLVSSSAPPAAADPGERPDIDRYAFAAGAFRAILTVDPDGLVADYEFFAERIFRR